MATAKDNQSVLEQAAAVISAAARHATKDGTLAAIGREAIKDVRNTINEVFFGQGEHTGEPGAPLNLTQGEVAELRREESASPLLNEANNRRLPSPSEIAAETQPYAPQADQGHDHDRGVALG